MTWIETIPPEKATGGLARLYDRIEKQRGKVARVLEAQSLHPAALKHHLALYQAVLFQQSAISRADRELLAVVISAENDCRYCVAHHREALARLTDESYAASVAQDYREADLSAKQTALIAYAIKLTREPASVKEEDVEDLREAGFSDRTILDLNLVTSYFNFVNRIVEGLGVKHDEEEMRGYRY